jgi:hypothetical protein
MTIGFAFFALTLRFRVLYFVNFVLYVVNSYFAMADNRVPAKIVRPRDAAELPVDRRAYRGT